MIHLSPTNPFDHVLPRQHGDFADKEERLRYLKRRIDRADGLARLLFIKCDKIINSLNVRSGAATNLRSRGVKLLILPCSNSGQYMHPTLAYREPRKQNDYRTYIRRDELSDNTAAALHKINKAWLDVINRRDLIEDTYKRVRRESAKEWTDKNGRRITNDTPDYVKEYIWNTRS